MRKGMSECWMYHVWILCLELYESQVSPANVKESCCVAFFTFHICDFPQIGYWGSTENGWLFMRCVDNQDTSIIFPFRPLPSMFDIFVERTGIVETCFESERSSVKKGAAFIVFLRQSSMWHISGKLRELAFKVAFFWIYNIHFQIKEFFYEH